MTEKDVLEHIYKNYHEDLCNAGRLYGFQPKILAGIMCRETAGGLSPFLDKLGPEGRGDKGHGRGLMQIDDRWWQYFTSTDKWKVPRENIKFGAMILSLKLDFMKNKFIDYDYNRLLRYAIAAYNAGEGNVFKALKRGDDCDSVTAHKNYSSEVLRVADEYELVMYEGDLNKEKDHEINGSFTGQVV